MDDWKSLIDQAMQIETTDTIGAPVSYTHLTLPTTVFV